MGKYVINGGKRLSGQICLETAKNAVLPMLAGAVMTNEDVVIRNCPQIADVDNMLKILIDLGVDVKREKKDVIINSKNINSFQVEKELAQKLRSSVFLMGALTGRFNKAEICFPGGCSIGARPIELHLRGLKKLGVKIKREKGLIECETDKIIGNSIWLDFPSVGATENIMMASVFADGKTEIHNAAKEPEVVDLMCFLNSMGAKIYGAGTSTILIEGVKKLHGTDYYPISDRIEAGTYLACAAITGGEIEILNCRIKNICSLIHKFCDNTCKINIKNDIIHLKNTGDRRGFSFSTGPYPHFPTDMQAPMMALATVSKGVSVITENIFESRFLHVEELRKMGADITVKGKTAIVKGIDFLRGEEVTAKDLRGGAALVVAGLNAHGQTVINGLNHIKRGYVDMQNKLLSLGADIIIEE